MAGNRLYVRLPAILSFRWCRLAGSEAVGTVRLKVAKAACPPGVCSQGKPDPGCSGIRRPAGWKGALPGRTWLVLWQCMPRLEEAMPGIAITRAWGMCIPSSPAGRWTGRGCATCCFCRAA